MSEKISRIAYVASAPFTDQILKILLKISSISVVGVWTKTPKSKGRGRIIQQSPLIQFCQQVQIPVFPVETLNSTECQKQWQVLCLDAALIVAHGQIIKPFIYTIPIYGTFNIHFSLLPKYRGPSPIQSSILQGDSISGITLQKIDDHCDTGNIVLQNSFCIKGDDAQQVLEKSIVACQQLLLKWSMLLFLGEIPTIKQQHHQHSICSKISKQDGRIFPYDSVETVEKKFRAFIGWPGIFFVTSDKKFIKLLSIGQGFVGETFKKFSGHLIYLPNENLIQLVLSNGSFVVEKIQLEGKSPILAREFINGFKHLFPIPLFGEQI